MSFQDGPKVLEWFGLVDGWSCREQVGRLKPNGRLVSRSPPCRVVEPETLRLGVEGQAAGWRTLRVCAEHDPRLDYVRFDELIGRARRLIDQLERSRVQAATEAFGGEIEPVETVSGNGEADDNQRLRNQASSGRGETLPGAHEEAGGFFCSDHGC